MTAPNLSKNLRFPILFLVLAMVAAVCLPVASLSAQEVSRVSTDGVAPVQNLGKVLGPAVTRSFDNKALFTIQYDDGEADNGYGVANTATFYDNVMRFDLGASNLSVEEFEVCFSRLGSDPDIDFEINFWAADGPGGAPGTFIDGFLATAEDVSLDLAGTYYLFDLSPFDLMLPNQTVYAGVGWDPSSEQDFFVCSDWDRSSVQPAYSQVNQDGVWNTPPAGDANYTAMMYRLTLDDGAGTGGGGDCVPDSVTLCLNDSRFQVTGDFRTPAGQMGEAQAVQLTDDTGYFWFFNADNVEMVLKVLDGCPVNNHYWVFAGGLTNVEVMIRVEDTETGDVRNYTNPLRTPFQPIQDTGAFLTCP
ncbi:MAG: hypothetical protein SX243_25105 [Acidobacteriota bacterium]|nr:hypothetical protein [Acidobacteriota bacterium]